MREQRSASQILFGFLPEQTADLKGGIWKVKEWQEPIDQNVDATILRRELIRQASPWTAAGRDGGFGQHMYQSRNVRVLSLNRDAGVKVEPFPQVWMCRRCGRVRTGATKACKCGSRRFGQLPFVGYHDSCGALRQPYIPTCPDHNDVRVILPGTASAKEIRFVCPECGRELRRGFGLPKCSCGKGRLVFNVHRAASVYVPLSVVVVNAPSQQKVKRLTDAGGPSRALTWVLDGLRTPNMEGVGFTEQAFVDQMIAQGFAGDVARDLARQAAERGAVSAADGESIGGGAKQEQAEAQAVTIAMALSESRRRISDMLATVDTTSELDGLYRHTYPAALETAGLEDVEFLDRFPVLTGVFGYTRGSTSPGESRLVPFSDKRGNYVVYGDVTSTEALFVRLRPTLVVRWLQENGHALDRCGSEREARLAVLRAADFPSPGDDPRQASVGAALLRLVHSYAHRLIRHAAVLAGIDRNALSELIVPAHLSFFMFAAARGDFVLGGLQAVFETELDRLLRAVALEEHRCPLDPGCKRAGGACMACLHLGEPSCRYYNQFLDRSVLAGQGGYFTSVSRKPQSYQPQSDRQ